MTLGPIAIAYAAVAGPHAFDAFAYHGSRPLQIQSVYSGLLMLVQPFRPALVGLAFDYGSLNLASPVEPVLRAISSALLVAGLATAWLMGWRGVTRARHEDERLLAVVVASFACLVAYITLGRIFSPQYCVWLIPLAATAAAFVTAPARRLLPVSFLMIQAEYPFLFSLLYSWPTPITGGFILLRTVWLWRSAAAQFGTSLSAAKGHRPHAEPTATSLTA